ncbi:MAG: carbonic anhydrase [Pseudomonadota bacterium]
MTKKLVEGFEHFRKYQYEDESALMPKLIEEGQSPRYFMISCIDSRSNPGVIFRTKPGAFFSHKAMGAIVRPYKKGTALAAALQFALEYNDIKIIVVLGHTQCGAISALVNDIEDEEIKSFVSVAKSAQAKAEACCSNHGDLLKRTEQETVLESAENLKSYPSVAKALEEGRVVIKPWIFDMAAGDILEYNFKTEEFEVITPHEAIDDSRHAKSA